MFDLKGIVRPNILLLEPYKCARDFFKTGILLDANENTHGPALATVSSIEDELELNRYPDPHQIELKEQIVAYRNAYPSKFSSGKNKLKPANLCLGVGSDESIDLLLRCVCTPGKDKLLVCPPTYGMYSICAKINDVALTEVPLLYPGFQIDIDAVSAKLAGDKSIKLVYLTSPGNPTGKLLAVDDIVTLLKRVEDSWNGLIVIDEAYIDFTDIEDGNLQSLSTLVTEYPRLVVLQTVSKSFGLAGIRLGITYATPELSGYLNAMKYPYNISSLTSDVGLRATGKEGLAKMEEYVALIVEQRSWLLAELQKLKYIGENIGGLDSNFLLLQILNRDGVPCNKTAQELYTKLATLNEVVVRFRGTELNCEGALRISVGTKKENEILVEKFSKCLKEINGD